MIHLRLIVPSELSARVLDTLVADARVTSIVQLPGTNPAVVRLQAA